MQRVAQRTIGVLVCFTFSLAAPPLPVMDLHIQVENSASLRLDWSPVSQDTLGNQLRCVHYDVYKSPQPGFLPSDSTWIASTGNPTWLDGLWGERSFYRVQVQSCDMVLIPAGQFLLGQTGVQYATPEHSVTLTHDYLLGRTEVTNGQYLEALNWAKAQGLVTVEGDFVQQYDVLLLTINQSGTDLIEIRYNPGTQRFVLHAGTYDAGSWGPGEAYPGGSYDPADHPVNCVSWYGAACYCDWRSLMEGLPPYYNGNWSQTPNPNNPYTAPGYRLPMEEEWEFAAQYDDERMYPWGSASPSCDLVNYSATTGVEHCVGWSSPVGAFPAGATALGLQDMAGNVWEMCNNWYQSYSAGAVTDPIGPPSVFPAFRLMRGGGWWVNSLRLPCAYRNNCTPSHMSVNVGFRLCRTAP